MGYIWNEREKNAFDSCLDIVLSHINHHYLSPFSLTGCVCVFTLFIMYFF